MVKKAYKERHDALTDRTYLQSHPRFSVASHWKEKFQVAATSAARPGSDARDLEVGNIDYKPYDVDIKWLQWCAVGFLAESRDIYDLQQLLEKQSICCTFRHMGGKWFYCHF